MSKTTLTIPFSADPGDGENHWIRLEQVRKPDEGVTMAQAAALIDAMYGIEPCEDGMGNGGEAADEEALPEEEDFLEMAREMLDLDICDETEPLTWDAEVDVFRSHQEDAYNLQGELIEVGEATPMSRSVTEVVDVGGNSHDLTWPCAGGVSVSGAGATVRDVRGSTVNFTASVRGRVRISYTAVWDRVALKVRRFAMPELIGGVSIESVMAVAGDNTGKTSREDDEASVVAFWRDLAAECALTRPPEDDQGIDQAEIERLCNRQTDWQVVGDCWKRIETFNLCNCSGMESPEQPEPEDVDAPCPEGVRPDSFLGVERKQGEYVDCPGEDKEGLNTEEFFRDHCCEEKPYSPLPRCRVTWEENKGGAEIEGGPEYWKSVYGENVRLTPVTPEGGRCGEIIRKWNVPGEIGGPPELPERLRVRRGQSFSVTVLSGGRAPFEWRTPPGVTHLGDAAYGFIGLFRANESFGGGDLVVADACGRTAVCELTTRICKWVWSPEQTECLRGLHEFDDRREWVRCKMNPPGGPYVWKPMKERTDVITVDGRPLPGKVLVQGDYALDDWISYGGGTEGFNWGFAFTFNHGRECDAFSEGTDYPVTRSVGDLLQRVPWAMDFSATDIYSNFNEFLDCLYGPNSGVSHYGGLILQSEGLDGRQWFGYFEFYGLALEYVCNDD